MGSGRYPGPCCTESLTLVPAACGWDAIQVHLPVQQASFTYLQQPNYSVVKLFLPDMWMKSLPNDSTVPL